MWWRVSVFPLCWTWIRVKLRHMSSGHFGLMAAETWEEMKKFVDWLIFEEVKTTAGCDITFRSRFLSISNTSSLFWPDTTNTNAVKEITAVQRSANPLIFPSEMFSSPSPNDVWRAGFLYLADAHLETFAGCQAIFAFKKTGQATLGLHERDGDIFSSALQKYGVFTCCSSYLLCFC